MGANDDVYSHPGFTESLDYEGEVGVIIGKTGFNINESNAMDHVWGYTIINGECNLNSKIHQMFQFSNFMTRYYGERKTT